MNPKIVEVHHRDPYVHELGITVCGHDNSQTEFNTSGSDNNEKNIYKYNI